MSHEKILAKFAKLKVDRSKGIAPHKPLLLLVLLDLAKHRLLDSPSVKLTPDLAYRFSVYWSIVAHRRTQPPDVRLPFFHLHTSKLWTTHAADGSESTHRNETKTIVLTSNFFESVQSSDFREQAAYLLISNYFEPKEQVALYEMAGLSPPDNVDLLDALAVTANQDAKAEGRTARFRVDVVAAYCHTCALTGYRVSTISGYSIVDAAHIHKFSRSQNDDPQNGLALCKNAHWLFDLGLWSVDENLRIIVAEKAFEEDCPTQDTIKSMAGRRLILPQDEQMWPKASNLTWHREKCFVG